jgi:hypothetical protein
MQDMLFLGSPVDLGGGFALRGVLNCCRATFDNQCTVATATGLERFLFCKYCKFWNQIEANSLMPVIEAALGLPCIGTSVATVQSACADCLYTGTDASACDGLFVNPISF